MPHDLRIVRPSDRSAAAAPDIPMLHPLIQTEFTWGGQRCSIHAQRKKPDTLRLHQHWFYLRRPDGSFHELQHSRLRQHLTHPPEFSTTTCIAACLEAEPGQTTERLEQIIAACGL